MKKFVALALALVMSLSLVACGAPEEVIEKFEKEIEGAGIDTAMVSPKLLPDYTRKVN